MPSRRRHRERDRTAAVANTAPEPSPSLAMEPLRADVSSGVGRIETPEEAATLAARLLGDGRTHPVVVVSIPGGESEPRIDAEEIAHAVQGLAEVVLLPTDERSWRFSAAMPEMTQVYGGAGRVYPVDWGWVADPHRSPLRFAYDARGGERATDELISDALRMARDAGLLSAARTHAMHRAAEGVVGMLVEPSRAMVQLSDGSLATIWQELTAEGVGLSDLLSRGMKVTGSLDTDTGRLDVTSMLTGPDAVGDYKPGDVVLARVTAVRPDVVHLALHPDVVVPVQRHQVSDDPDEALTALFTVGETVVARVVTRAGDRFTLRLDDVEDGDDPLPAPPVLRGGPAWLRSPVPAVDAAEDTAPETEPTVAPREAPSAAAPPAAPAPRGALRDLSLTLEAAKVEIRRLEAEVTSSRAALEPAEVERDQLRHVVAAQQAELHAHGAEIARLKTQLRQHVMARKQRGKDAAGTSVGTQLFLDPLEQFRFEVQVEWATRIGAAEKAERPLRDYTVGPEFIASLDRVEGVDRRKVVQVVVEVLTGLADRLDSREVHALRTGPGGDAPPVVREDGAMCMRAALQRNTPSARRLHYWRNGDRIELSRVTLHDDMRP